MSIVWQIITDTIKQSFNTILKLAFVMLILLIIIEILREYGIMEKITGKLKWAAMLMDIPDEGMLAVVVGLLGGLSYSSSILYDFTKNLQLTRKQLNTIFILLGICHSVIEETAVYAATGANAILGLLCRVVFGVLFVALYRIITRQKRLAHK